MKRTNGASVSLAEEAVAYLSGGGDEVPIGEGQTIVRRGEAGTAFWVVLDGTVEVRLTGTDGVHLPLARMGRGSSFGEMSLITGDPVSADVVALTPARLLRYPAAHFSAAVGECEPLRAHIMERLASSLRGTSAEVWNFFQKAKALDVLMDPHREDGPIVAESGAMKPVREAVARFGREEGSVLVTGAPGTGKLFVASRIHEASGRADAPFIGVDCRTLEPREAMRFLFGSEAGLGEEGDGNGDGALRRYGALQLADGGTLVLRHPELLPREVQEAVGRYVALKREGRISYPATRVIATSLRSPAEFAGAASPGLGAAFDSDALVVPRMTERRRDVVPLARHFLARCANGGAKSLSRSAEHVLVSLRYSHRNAAELHEAVEMAALIADDPSIQAEHIFAGPKDQGSVHEIDLTPIPLVRSLIAPRVVGAVRATVFASFAAILALTLFAGATAPGRVANSLTWGLWEPALFVAFFVFGRVWCTVCPISAAGRIAARLKNFDVPPGSWIKDNSGWFIIAGFLLVIWSEHAFRMTERPRAAGFLLLALFAAASIFGVVFRRETWCRYVCPLGNLGAIYSLGAVLNVRANPNVCATSCTTHECFKGSRSQPGCPVFHHPLYASDAHACKLCFQCLRVCPHGSARLSLRLPLQSVWAQADVGGALVPFALFLFFFAPAMLASQGDSWTATVPGFTATALLALVATAIFAKRLPRLLATTADPEPTLATRAAFSMLVLAWGPAMAFQLRHIAVLDSLRLHAEAGSLAVGFLPSGEISLLLVAQLGVTLLASIASAICFAGIRSRLQRDGAAYSLCGWNLLMAVLFCYQVGTVALIIPRGLHY